MKGRRRNFGWPVELRIVPLIKLLLFLIFRIISLMRQMFVVVAHLVKNRSLFPLPVNLLVACTFEVLSKPRMERVVRVTVTIRSV